MLSAPPRDVDRLLKRYETDLPQYLDVQRQEAARVSGQRWPLIRKSSPAPVADTAAAAKVPPCA